MEVKLKGVRGAFLHLHTPQENTNEDGTKSYKYNGVFIIDPKDPVCNEIRKAMKEAAKAKWADKWEKTHDDLVKKDRVCFRDGTDKSDYDGFDGMMYISASNKVKPLIVDRRPKNEDGTPNLLTAAHGRPYAGCYMNVTVDIWAQDNKFGKRINADLTGVQFVKDGDAFAGGKPASVDDFDDLGEGADADDLDDVA